MFSSARFFSHGAFYSALFAAIGGFILLYITPAEGLELFNGLLVFDRLARFFSLLIMLSLSGTLLILRDHARNHHVLNEVYALLGFASAGLLVMVSSRDLFTLFVGLEIASLSIYVLVGSQRYAKASAEAALKYFILGGVASAVFLYGVSIYYGTSGGTLYSQFQQVWAAYHISNQLPILPLFGFFLIVSGFIFKLGGFPLHFWIPDVYSGAPLPVTAFMITAVKAAAIATFLRFVTEVLALSPLISRESGLYWVLYVAALGSLLFGALVGLQQTKLKRMLAYSTIVHSGFLLIGILAAFVFGGKADSFRAVYSYALFYVLMNLGAFAILDRLSWGKKEDLSLADLSGLHEKHPILAFAFSLCMMSMAGLPQTAGFLGKYMVLEMGVAAGQMGLVLAAVLASAVSIGFYLKPLVYMYMLEAKSDTIALSYLRPGILVTAVAVFFTVFLGFFPSFGFF